MGLRVGGPVLFLGGGVVAAWLLADPNHEDIQGSTVIAIGLGGLLAVASYVTGAVRDIATADDAARAWNRRHGHVQVTPTAIVGAHGPAAGLALTGSF